MNASGVYIYMRREIDGRYRGEAKSSRTDGTRGDCGGRRKRERKKEKREESIQTNLIWMGGGWSHWTVPPISLVGGWGESRDMTRGRDAFAGMEVGQVSHAVRPESSHVGSFDTLGAPSQDQENHPEPFERVAVSRRRGDGDHPSSSSSSSSLSQAKSGDARSPLCIGGNNDGDLPRGRCGCADAKQPGRVSVA